MDRSALDPGDRGAILTRYSPFAADRTLDSAALLALVLEEAQESEAHQAQTPSGSCRLSFARQVWESEYFQRQTVKLAAPLFECGFEDLAKPLADLAAQLRSEGVETLFTEVPAEDTLWLQTLTGQGGFRLLETRLHYYLRKVSAFEWPRSAVRDANEADIPNLRRVASEMRNDYDRFHADARFPNDLADAYLATYTENCVRGFADIVLVPDEPGLPADSFISGRLRPDLKERLGLTPGINLLSAVSSATNRGWYLKLLAEITRTQAARGAEAVFMNTQATNGAVLHTWGKLGYKFGRATHVLTRDLKIGT